MIFISLLVLWTSVAAVGCLSTIAIYEVLAPEDIDHWSFRANSWFLGALMCSISAWIVFAACLLLAVTWSS